LLKGKVMCSSIARMLFTNTMCRDILCCLWEAIHHKHPHLWEFGNCCFTITLDQFLSLLSYGISDQKYASTTSLLSRSSPCQLLTALKNENPLEGM
jgi:hypothetical protein